jgi:hypothetical protein
VVDEPKLRRKTLADLQFPEPAPPPSSRPKLPPIVEPDLEPDPELGLDPRQQARAALRVVEDPPDDHDGDDGSGDAGDDDDPDFVRPPARRPILEGDNEPVDAQPPPPGRYDAVKSPSDDDEADELGELDLFDEELDGELDPALAPPPGYRPRD